MGEEHHPIWLRRFLDQGTTWQKSLLSIGAIATAVLAIGSLALAISRLVDSDDDPTRPEPTTTFDLDGERAFRSADPLTSETADADELIALLTNAADAYAEDPNSPDARVTLDFHVDEKPQNSGRIRLNYGCSNEPPCQADLQAWEPTMFDENSGATFFRGVYIVRIQQGERDRNIELGLRKVAELAG